MPHPRSLHRSSRQAHRALGDYRDIIDRVHAELQDKWGHEHWARKHISTWRTAQNDEAAAIRDMIVAWGKYASAFTKRYPPEPGDEQAVRVGDDGFLGDQMVEIGRGIRQLLNGEIGGFDGGTLDRLILGIAEINNIDLE
jgi:hypothetical protein